MSLLLHEFLRRVGGILLGGLLLGSPLAARAAEPLPAPPQDAAALDPRLRAAAEQDGIRVFHLDASADAPSVGDSVVAWIGATDGETSRQWLLRIRRVDATERERERWEGRSQTRYLSWGPVLHFGAEAEALQLWLAGPVEGAPAGPGETELPARIRRLRVSVPGDYLRLGLQHAALVHRHITRRLTELNEQGQQPNVGQIYSLTRPIDPESQKYAIPVAEQLELTEAMSRAWAGGSVALQAFYEVINDATPLRAIADDVIARPAFWKLPRLAFGTNIKSGLGGPNTRPVEPAELGLLPVGEAHSLEFGMSFGEEPMVAGELVVGWPVPPLDVCAGILGLYAVNPREPEKRVHLVVIGAERSAAAQAADEAAAP